MIATIWFISNIPIFATWSINDKLLLSIYLDRFCYILNFVKCCYIFYYFEYNCYIYHNRKPTIISHTYEWVTGIARPSPALYSLHFALRTPAPSISILLHGYPAKGDHHDSAVWVRRCAHTNEEESVGSGHPKTQFLEVSNWCSSSRVNYSHPKQLLEYKHLAMIQSTFIRPKILAKAMSGCY